MLQTACFEWHAAHGGRMVDFAGWNMPVLYTSITDEHHAVRNACGLFDIAHMGRLRFSGPQAGALLDSLLTIDVPRVKPGQVRYALVTNDKGGILDDVLLYRFDDHFLLVVNASNREKICTWIDAHRGGLDAAVDDQTLESFMLALQGPKSAEILTSLAGDDAARLKYYMSGSATLLGRPALISRTGYTGEDGFEVIAEGAIAVPLWEAVLQAGQGQGIHPAGLGCRDTLRLEAGMPLYGHEIDESTDPFLAGLGFAVKLDAGEFVGKQSLLAAAEQQHRPRRVGLELDGRRIARQGAIVYAADSAIGRVTSGTFSPTLQKSVAMAYVPPEFALPGSRVEIDIRGKRESAGVVSLPFYSRRR